jgi:hypothetical protein
MPIFTGNSNFYLLKIFFFRYVTLLSQTIFFILPGMLSYFIAFLLSFFWGFLSEHRLFTIVRKDSYKIFNSQRVNMHEKHL